MKKGRIQASRMVGYHFEGIEGLDEDEVRRLLERAVEEDVVKPGQWYAKNSTVWFNGKAGPKMRKLRDAVEALVGKKSMKRTCETW